MVPGRRLSHPIELAFPWIFCGTFFQDNSLLILKTCWLPQSPGLMVPDKLKTHVFHTHPVMLEEQNIRIQQEIAAIPKEHLQKAMSNLHSWMNKCSTCE
jgi:hypothetical protein